MNIQKLHHVAIVCSNYERSKQFYTDVLGFKIEKEIYREERKSFKLDLSLNGEYILELFSFPDPPARLTQPEAAGLRHLAFGVLDLEACIKELLQNNIDTERVRTDEFTSKKFTFLYDPDHLPIELYEL
ncbi:VOC family protein [Christiangramia marina]|uniref:SMU1112c/YaeR family gloxylase I-like metalloprotein n=1 Tax=Christiangramia marina TaxID=409436 RepID=UPI003AA8F00B